MRVLVGRRRRLRCGRRGGGWDEVFVEFTEDGEVGVDFGLAQVPSTVVEGRILWWRFEISRRCRHSWILGFWFGRCTSSVVRDEWKPVVAREERMIAHWVER